jgi:hypothetical protein
MKTGMQFKDSPSQMCFFTQGSFVVIDGLYADKKRGTVCYMKCDHQIT